MTPGPAQDEVRPLTPGFAIVLTVGAAFIQFVLAILLSAPDPPSVGQLGIASIVGYGVLFAAGASRLQPPPQAALGFVAAPSRAWLAALLLVPASLLVSEFDNVFRDFMPRPDLPLADAAVSGLPLLELGLVLILVLPVIEETFFRGMIQPAMVERLGRAGGIASSAALSALAVLWLGGPWMMLFKTANGLLLGFLRECSGSLLPGIGLACAFGALSVLATQQFFGIPGFDDLEAAHTPLEWLVPAALATGLGLRLCQTLAADPVDPESGPIPRR